MTLKTLYKGWSDLHHWLKKNQTFLEHKPFHWFIRFPKQHTILNESSFQKNSPLLFIYIFIVVWRNQSKISNHYHKMEANHPVREFRFPQYILNRIINRVQSNVRLAEKWKTWTKPSVPTKAVVLLSNDGVCTLNLWRCMFYGTRENSILMHSRNIFYPQTYLLSLKVHMLGYSDWGISVHFCPSFCFAIAYDTRHMAI